MTETEILEDLYKDINEFLRLPNTSELSDTLYLIYIELCQTDNNMIWIDDEDSREYYNLTSKKDIQKLKEEVEKLHLQDYIEFEEGKKLTVYGGLQCCFNDDRSLEIDDRGSKVYFVSKEFIKNNIDLFSQTNKSSYKLIVFKDDDLYIAIDDSEGECFTEEFRNLEQAVYWLQNCEATAEEVKEMDIPHYITYFVEDMTTKINKEYENEL